MRTSKFRLQNIRLQLSAPALLLMMTAIVMCGGCESKEELLPQTVVHTPLELDPTERLEISQWWTNTKQLLRLQPSGTYSIFAGQNRYAQAIEHGRWHRERYNLIVLQPYQPMGEPTHYAKLDRTDEKLFLQVADLRPMVPIAHPPRIVEDEIIGRWHSDRHTLALNRDMSYSLTLRSGNDQPGGKARVGTWTMAGNVLTLMPQQPDTGVIRLRFESAVDQQINEPVRRMQLSSPDAVYHRADDLSAEND